MIFDNLLANGETESRPFYGLPSMQSPESLKDLIDKGLFNTQSIVRDEEPPISTVPGYPDMYDRNLIDWLEFNGIGDEVLQQAHQLHCIAAHLRQVITCDDGAGILYQLAQVFKNMN